MTETLERSETQDCGSGMDAKPQAEHAWLSRMVGDWTFQSTRRMGPDQPPMTSTGRQTNRSLGGLWLIGEGEGGTPGGTMNSVITLGFDPTKGKFVGTFIASMMTHLWPYEGTLDGNVLTLDSEGPSFSGDGSVQAYKDVVEIVDDDHWILRGTGPGPDGQWIEFMTAHYRRA